MAPSADAVQTVASNLSAHFSESSQILALTATVSDTTNPSTTVSEGTVTFTVKDSSGNTVGSPVSGTVSGGKASANFTLPADEAAGSYNIDVSYSDSPSTNFTDGGDTAGKLTVDPANIKVVGSNAAATFNTSSQSVTLTASLTDDSFPSDTVNAGTVTFTVKNSSSNTVGSSVQGTVSNGTASASFTLPAGEAAGSYTLAVAYSDGSSGNFSDDGTDTSGKLTLSAASTTTAARSATASFSSSAQNVTLTATVTSSSGTVNEGSVTFTLFDSNGNTVGTSTTGSVTNGSASVSFALPAGTAVGTYSINASYTDSAGSFASSSDNTHSLSVATANSTQLSLTSGSITPSALSGTAQVTLTAQVSNAGGTVNEGVLSFTVAGVSSQANVSNGTATVTLTVPLESLTNGFVVALSYTDNAASASFANSNASTAVSTSVWNAILPATLTFDSSGNESIQFTVASLSLFGASYSSSTGLLSSIDLGSTSMEVTYTPTGNSTVASIGGVPWGVILDGSSGNFLGTADVVAANDGSFVWGIYDANGNLVSEFPYYP